MTTNILNAVLYGCKLIALAAILSLSLCLYIATMFLIGVNSRLEKPELETPEAPNLPLLQPAKERRHNATEPILNGTLIAFKKPELKTSEAPRVLLLLPAKERNHNATETIQNGTLITTAPKKQAQAKPKKQAQSQAQIEKPMFETDEIFSRSDLKKMSKILLQRECKTRKLKGYSKLSKPQLIELLAA